MLAHDYAKALNTSIANGMTVPKALDRLDAILAEKGHQRLRPRILRALLTLVEAHEKEMTPVVTVANEKDAEKLSSQIHAVLKEMGTHKDPVISEDPHIIGGFIVDQGDQKIDKSYKTVLTTLYRNITR